MEEEGNFKKCFINVLFFKFVFEFNLNFRGRGGRGGGRGGGYNNY